MLFLSKATNTPSFSLGNPHCKATAASSADRQSWLGGSSPDMIRYVSTVFVCVEELAPAADIAAGVD
jgi:hypothetical protein